MGFVAVDIGNTSVKFTLAESGETFVFPTLAAALKDDRIMTLREGLPGGAGKSCFGFSATRKLSSQEESAICKMGWWEFRSDCPVPVEVAYQTPETLGADRLAAAIGAWAEYPDMAVLIADLGTALTLDIMDHGVYRGGNISPGMEMRFEALHHYTSRLPKVSLTSNEGFFGTSTETAISQGVMWGIVNEIIGACSMAKNSFGCSRLLLTGGDAMLLKDKIDRFMPPEVGLEVKSGLVAQGIMEVYRYNHDK